MSISNNNDTKQSVSFNLPTYVNAEVMTGAAITVTVPTEVSGERPAQAVLSATGNFYVRFGGTAAIPSAQITNGTGSLLNPTYFRVFPGMVFSIIGAPGVVVTMSFDGE